MINIKSLFEQWQKKKAILMLAMLASPISMWCIYSEAQQAESKCSVPLVKSPTMPPFYGEKTCPIVGRIGNIKLAIPQEYVLGPIAYKGVDIWKAESYKNGPKHPTLDTEIDNVAIRVRLSNFKPIESRKDLEDYEKLGKLEGWKQPFENRWIYVGLKTVNVANRGYTMKSTFENWIKDTNFWGPFVKSPSIWNLDHYVSTQQPISQRNPYIQKGQFEFYYDSKTEDAFAYCENVLTLSPDGKNPSNELISHCHINFLIRDMNIEASVSEINFKDDIARWAEIKQGIRRLVQSFIAPQIDQTINSINSINSIN